MASKSYLADYPTTRELALAFRSLADDLPKVDDPDSWHNIEPDVCLRNWTCVTTDAVCLSGLAAGHPTLNDGPILTSDVFYVNFELGLARTYSRWSRLIGPALSGDYPTN